MREEKVLKTAYAKQTNFFWNVNNSSENAVKTSFLLSEMVAKSSKLFTKGLYVK